MGAADLTLCVPAYNAAGFLPRLLESARVQTVPFAEILVYDDASSDDTGAVAARLGARVVRGESNRGCSRGKNVLARESSCRWLHFHDADDALRPNFVEQSLQWLERSEVDVVFFAYETRIHETDAPAGRRAFDDGALKRDAVAYLLAEQVNPFCGLYRRDAFLRAGGWDEDPLVLQAEDQAGHLRLALAGLRFAADPAETVVNFIRQGSMTTRNLAGANRAVFRHLDKALRQPLTPAQAAIAATRLWRVAGSAAAYLDWETAGEAARLAQCHRGALPPETGRLFRILAPLSPSLALRVREELIRLLRPAQRRGPAYHPGPP